MKKLKVYLYWNYGDYDGDGYYETIDVSDEKFEILKNLEGEDLEYISDERVRSFCKKQYRKLIKDLKYNSDVYEDEDSDEEITYVVTIAEQEV